METRRGETNIHRLRYFRLRVIMQQDQLRTFTFKFRTKFLSHYVTCFVDELAIAVLFRRPNLVFHFTDDVRRRLARRRPGDDYLRNSAAGNPLYPGGPIGASSR